MIDDVIGSISFLRQQHHHVPKTVSIRNLNCRVGLVLDIADIDILAHHGHFGAALFSRELLVFGILGVELLGPVGLEIDGIEQIRHHIRLHFVQNRRNHPFRLFLTPTIDVAEGLRRRKVEGFGLRIVIILHILLKLRLQRIVLVDEDGIGDIQFYIRISLREVVDQILAIVVHGLDAALMEAKRLFEFLLGVARRGIVHHAEHVGDAER